MRYDFETQLNRKNTKYDLKTSKKIVKEMFGLNYYEDTIPMWVADMDFKNAPEIIHALQSRLESDVLGYALYPDEFYDSVIAWYEKRRHNAIQKEWIFYANGTLAAITDAMLAITKEGEQILVQPPVYSPFSILATQIGRIPVQNNLVRNTDGSYEIDFEDFEKKCSDPKTTMFILCNPHNPIGRIWNREEVMKLLAIAKAHNVVVFADEVHSDIVRKGQDVPSVLGLGYDENIIFVISPNKTFNLAAMHATFVVIPGENLREKFRMYGGDESANVFSIIASTAAYSEGAEWVNQLNDVIDENFNYMADFIQHNLPKVSFRIPDATYLAWVDFKQYGKSEQEVLQILADEAHVILEGSSMFGAPDACCVRMNIAVPKSVLMDALNRIKNALEK